MNNLQHSRLTMTISIVCHRLFEAFALGVCCRKADIKLKPATAGLFAYALVLPLCIVIGGLIFINTDSSSHLWLDVIFQGIAAGTFLYISILEIVSEEMCNGSGNWSKIIFLFIGSAIICGVGFTHVEH